MAGVNKVILVGNLGDDPEARSLNNGGEVVNLRVATSETWKDRDGNRQERTEWHRVVIFNENLGKVAKSYLRRAPRCISRARSRPGNGPTSPAPTATRPKSCCSASAASWSCSTAAKAAGGGRGSAAARISDDFGGGDGAATRTQARPRRRRSTPTSTTTSRSDRWGRLERCAFLGVALLEICEHGERARLLLG